MSAETKMMVVEGLTTGVWVELTRTEATLNPGTTWETVMEEVTDFLAKKDLMTATFTTETVSTKFRPDQFIAFRARVEDL